MRKLNILTKIELKTLVCQRGIKQKIKIQRIFDFRMERSSQGLYLRKLEEAKNTLRQNMFLQNWGQMIINNGALLG